jgi:hypothetical protein
MDDRFQGTTPNAYEIPLMQAALGVKEVDGAFASNLGFWAVRLPGVHPILEWFGVSVNHRRDSKLTAPVPSHEIVVFSIDPETYFDPDAATFDPDQFSTYQVLPPVEADVQFGHLPGMLSDEIARSIAEQLVHFFVQGRLKPFADDLHPWRRDLVRTYGGTP